MKMRTALTLGVIGAMALGTIGLVGCGNISDVYLTNAKLFRDLAMVAAPICARKLLLPRPRATA